MIGGNSIQSKIIKQCRVSLFVILGLLLLSIMGPWIYERIYIPAQFTCSVRLEGNYCGIPISGAMVAWALAIELIRRVLEVSTGNMTLASASRALPFILGVVALLFQFICSLQFLLLKERPWHRKLFFIAWGLAALWSWGFLLSDSTLPRIQLWGFWLYFVLVHSVLAMEGALAIRKKAHKIPGIPPES